MINTNRAASLGLLCALAGSIVAPAFAQTSATKPHHSFLHRHRNLASAGAGVGAYKMAKHSKHGFAHRHPILTGAAAAAVTHHYAKKHN